MPLDPALATQPYCYLTTTGRVTGRPHQVEIWYALSGNTAYLMSGNSGNADWVRNLRRQPNVTLGIAEQTFEATARIVTDPAEDALARLLLLQKYATPQQPLTTWGQVALPVAIDLNV